ncbi:MAG: exodeoxyribonuclease VII large subunit [Ardenticatenales bacterium]|nr:exodeoxyribonuclease VII large subunit [Ardenticatenales bacterium]
MSTIYPVSRVTAYLRELIESDPLLSDVWIRGEVSNWTRARSGHCYFTLKDGAAEIRCVMWRDAAQRLPVLPRDGDEVIAAGYVSVYAERGSYQFYVAEMQPIGLGALYQRFELLKAALAAEGLFDSTIKKELPAFPRRIGIVTSPTAAALHDMLNVLRRRQPLVQVLLSPTLVQGNDAPAGIVRALARFERVRVDVIIVARGGGSIEDLWAFNEEVVARAIHACTTPIISGVGHEVDYTIADFVADQRAPTPSAAAELAVPDIRELRDNLEASMEALHEAMYLEMVRRRQHLTQEIRALERMAPSSHLREQRQRVDHLASRVERALTTHLQLQRSHLSGIQGKLGNLDPRATIARGYAIVADRATGRLVRAPSEVSGGQALRVTVEEGEFEVEVTEGHQVGP